MGVSLDSADVAFFKTSSSNAATQCLASDASVTSTTWILELYAPAAASCLSNHFMPAAQLPAFILRPGNAQPLSVAGQSLGAAALTDPEEREAKRQRVRGRDGRGRDRKRRAPKRCLNCLNAGRDDECKECPGRFVRANCPYL